MRTPSRRFFLAQGAALVAASAVPARSAAETINVACLGTGGRCQHLMRSLAKIKNVRIAAVCDVWGKHLADARKLADPKAVVGRDYKAILERKDIDAVLIGAPDHWHVPMTVDALGARKDVYVEKPLTHSIGEADLLLRTLEGSKQVVQVGTQQRSMPHIQKARELVKAKRLGKVVKVRMSWNRNADRVRRNKLGIDRKSVDWHAFLGNAGAQEFDEYRFRNWRWFWDFGGGIFTDLMVHWVDVAHWFLDLGAPTKAVSLGMHVNSKGVWETPDTVQTVMSYPGDVQMHFEGTFANANRAAHIEVMGTEGSLYVDRGRYEFVPERGKGKAEDLILGKGPKGRDFYETPDGELLHLQDWVASMRSRKQPSAPVSAGISAAAAAHLANKALRGTGVAEMKA